jgi:transcriptional regulator with XRE-family HTH domain
MTLQQVADALGISERTVRYWETYDPGHPGTPSGPQLFDLGDLYGVPPAQLVRRQAARKSRKVSR